MENQIQQIRQELEAAQNDIQEKRETFNKTQHLHRNHLLRLHEKMAFYSAGSISLSITYVGYLISQDKNILIEKIFTFPLYTYLLFSWFLLMLNLIISLFIRWTASRYVFWVRQGEYYKAKKELDTKRLSFLSTYPNIVFEKNRDKQTEIAICQSNINTLNNNLIPTNSRYEKLSFYVDKIFRVTTALFFVFGIFSLTFFASWSVFLRLFLI